MKLIVLNYEYPPVGGGGGQVTRSLAKEFAENGVEQTVVTGWFPGLSFYEKENAGVTVLRVPVLRFSRHRATLLTMASYVFSAFFPVLFLCLLKRPDLIHAHFIMPVGPLAWCINKITGIPYVITAHGGDIPGMDSGAGWLHRMFYPVSLKVVGAASAVTAVSLEIQRRAGDVFEKPFVYIPNGVSPDVFSAEPAVKNMDKIKIIFAGRLVKLKNVDLGVKAVGLLSRCLDLKFEIYGDGPEASGLKKLAEKEIPGIVEFHGWVERHILRKAFAASDIFLLLSDSEGFSIAALEAAASGCALILSDIPANRPLLENGSNGFFCEREISDIAGKIKKCIGGLESFKRKSIEKARGFMWAEAADKYVDVFREAITG